MHSLKCYSQLTYLCWLVKCFLSGFHCVIDTVGTCRPEAVAACPCCHSAWSAVAHWEAPLPMPAHKQDQPQSTCQNIWFPGYTSSFKIIGRIFITHNIGAGIPPLVVHVEFVALASPVIYLEAAQVELRPPEAEGAAAVSHWPFMEHCK